MNKLERMKNICRAANPHEPLVPPTTFLSLIDALETAQKALAWYADDYHIRNYEHGQLVILESSEVEEDSPNKAREALNKINERLKEIG
jgi:hypothetical protein